MNDFELFQSAIEQEHSYSTDLCRSLSLVLDEFYANLRCVGFSSMTGDGCQEFFEAVQDACEEYEQVYKVEYKKWQEKRSKRENTKREKDLKRLQNDLTTDQNLIGEKRVRYDDNGPEDSDDEDDDEEDEEEQENNNEEEEEKSFNKYLAKQMTNSMDMDT